MKVVEVYSHLNGLEYLMVHNKALWREIQQVIAAVDGQACRTKVSQEKGMKGDLKYSPIEMNSRFKALLKGARHCEPRLGLRK